MRDAAGTGHDTHAARGVHNPALRPVARQKRDDRHLATRIPGESDLQTNVLEYLERGALVRCPDGVAATLEDTACSYSELAERARLCAAVLCQRISETRQPIAVYLPKHWH